MGFLSKLGNVIQDGASFAVPAGLALGATALTGGNPMAGASILSALGAGAGGFARNEEEERIRRAQKAQNKNQSMANLINALSPRANFQAKQAKIPRAGALETMASGAQKGIQAYQMAMQAQQMAERAALQDDYLKTRTDYLKNQMAPTKGTSFTPDPKAGENFLSKVTEAGRYNPEGAGDIGVPMRVDATSGGADKTGSRFIGMTEVPLSTAVDDIRSGRTPGNTSEVETAFAKGKALAAEDDLTRRKGEASLVGDTDPGRDWGPILSVIETDPRQFSGLPAGEKLDVLAAMKDAGWDEAKIRDLTRDDISGETLTKFNELLAASRTFGNLRGQLNELGPEFVGIADGRLSSLDPDKRRMVSDFDSSLMLITQSLGRALQGRMTDQDLKIIQEIVGDRSATTFNDLQGKFDALDRFLNTGKAVFAESLDAGNIRRPEALMNVNTEKVDRLVEALYGMAQ